MSPRSLMGVRVAPFGFHTREVRTLRSAVLAFFPRQSSAAAHFITPFSMAGVSGAADDICRLLCTDDPANQPPLEVARLINTECNALTALWNESFDAGRVAAASAFIALRRLVAARKLHRFLVDTALHCATHEAEASQTGARPTLLRELHSRLVLATTLSESAFAAVCAVQECAVQVGTCSLFLLVCAADRQVPRRPAYI